MRYFRTVGTREVYGQPRVGALVAFDFAIWRVRSVEPIADVDLTDEQRERLAWYAPAFRDRHRPYHVVLRPVGVVGEDPRARDHDVSYSVSGTFGWDTYDDDEHYPVCAHCGGPVPCRWLEAQRAGENALKRMGRYELAGVCPACEEPVTARQRSLTWPDNVEVLGGPPVTFHLRRGCWRSAQAYERRWVADAPEQRRAVLSCRGHVTNHGDGTYECTEMVECPGPGAGHRSYTTCRPQDGTIYRAMGGLGETGCTDPACVAAPPYGCDPAPSAVRRG